MTCFFIVIFLTVIFLPIFPAYFRQYSRTSREPVRVCQTSVRPYTPTGTSAPITQNASFVAVSRRNDCVDSAWHSRTCHYDALLFEKIRDRGEIRSQGKVRSVAAYTLAMPLFATNPFDQDVGELSRLETTLAG